MATLFGRVVSLFGDTLAVRLLDEGEVATVRLPGYGMPRAGGERRARYVTSARSHMAAATGDSKSAVRVARGGESGG